MKKILILSLVLLLFGIAFFSHYKGVSLNQIKKEEKNINTVEAENITTPIVAKLLHKNPSFNNTFLNLIKENNPYILLDLSPEIRSLTDLNNNEQKEYLLKRALFAAMKKGFNHDTFKGKNKFTVHLIILTAVDEYGAPQWGSALSVAKINLNRERVNTIKANSIYDLSFVQLQNYIEQADFNLDAIKSIKNK